MSSRFLKVGLLALALALIAPTAALGDLSSEVQQGQNLARELGSGQKKCSQLAADDFELIGEYAMSIYLGDASAHEAMNSRMEAMMGKSGEERMHQALGYRYTGCPGGPASGWIGAMGGMMSGAQSGESGNYGGMMGGGYPHGFGMMGFGDSGDSDVGVGGVVLIALAAAAIGGALVYAGMRRSRSSS